MSEVILRENNNLISVYFESLLDFMNHNPSSKCRSNNERFDLYKESGARNTSRASERWFGQGNFSSGDVIKKSLIGDKELYKNLTGKIEEINNYTRKVNGNISQTIKKSVRKKVRANFGDEIDIHRVNSGNLSTAWSTTKTIKQDVQHQLVTLFIDISGLGDVDVSSTIWRAVVAIKLMDDLQKAGKSVRVLVGGSSEQAFSMCFKDFSSCVVVKQYNEKLSMERLAAMCHIGFYRTFGFASKMIQDNVVVKGLGFSLEMKESRLPLNIQEEIKKGHTKIIYVRKSTSLYSAVDSIKNAQSQIEEFSKT